MINLYVTAKNVRFEFLSRFNSLTALWVDSSWNVIAHGDARVGKWRGNWRMQWVACTLRTTSEHGVSSITTADAAHLGLPLVDWTDAPHRADLNVIRPFHRKTKPCFRACAITFQLASNGIHFWTVVTGMYLLWFRSFTLWCYRGFRSPAMWQCIAG